MSLKKKIQSELTASMIKKEELVSSVLRMLLTAVGNKETEKRTKRWKAKPEASVEELEKESNLTDEEIIDVVSSEIKKRKEAIELFQKGQKQDLADKEKKEAEILQKYLPEQFSEDEIKKLVKEVIAETGAKEPKDMGKVMAVLSPQIKGKADMGQVSRIVKEVLTPEK